MALVEACRAVGITVNSALCTAYLYAKRAVPELSHVSDGISFTRSIRGRLVQPVGDAVGLYALGAQTKPRFRADYDFWRNASGVHRLSQRELEHDKRMMSGLRMMASYMDPTLIDAWAVALIGYPPDPSVERHVKRRRGRLGGFVLTNIGGSSLIPSDYGPYKLNRVIFVPPAGPLPQILMGAAGIGGTVELSLPFRDSVFEPSLINWFGESFLDQLRGAIEGRGLPRAHKS